MLEADKKYDEADLLNEEHMEKSTVTKVAVCKFLDFIPRYVPQRMYGVFTNLIIIYLTNGPATFATL